MSPCEQLSPREVRVATMVWEGKTNPQIAAGLGSTEQVIKNQLRGIFDKLGVWSRLELALYVASHGGARWAESTNSEAANTQPPLLWQQSRHARPNAKHRFKIGQIHADLRRFVQIHNQQVLILVCANL